MDKDLVFYNVAGCTDVGVVRDNNEDAFIMADLVLGRTLPDTFHVSHKLGENSLLLVVSDGVGGSNGGEVASDLTVLAIKDALLRLPKTISPYDRLVAAVEEANHLVWNERQNSPALGNMSATVVAALIESNQVYIAEVGDSRAYLIRKNNIKQVTTDQSFVAQLVIKGVLKPEQAVKHPRRNVILQSVGNKEAVKVAVSMFQLQRNDIIILCTDGLSNLVRAEEILQISSTLSPENACWRMIQIAKERGGQDNITLILGRFYGDSLTSDVSVSRLTQAVKPLAVYDPDEVVEKSHKRTKYLGSASIVNKLYGANQQSSPSPQAPEQTNPNPYASSQHQQPANQYTHNQHLNPYASNQHQQPTNQQPANQQPANQQPANQYTHNQYIAQQPANQYSSNQQQPNQYSSNQQQPNQTATNQPSSKRYDSSEFRHLPRLSPTETLSAFPNAPIIKQECKMLIEHLDYCYQILALKPEQVEQAAQWLESSGLEYTRRNAMLKHLQDSLEQLKKITDVVSVLRKEWDK